MGIPAIIVDDGFVSMPARELHFRGGLVEQIGDEVASISFRILHGRADPTAGAGVAHSFPCLYLRDNAGTGELWLSTGAAPTAWAKVTVP